jgi:hypothetical protein
VYIAQRLPEAITRDADRITLPDQNPKAQWNGQIIWCGAAHARLKCNGASLRTALESLSVLSAP